MKKMLNAMLLGLLCICLLAGCGGISGNTGTIGTTETVTTTAPEDLQPQFSYTTVEYTNPLKFYIYRARRPMHIAPKWQVTNL